MPYMLAKACICISTHTIACIYVHSFKRCMDMYTYIHTHTRTPPTHSIVLLFSFHLILSLLPFLLLCINSLNIFTLSVQLMMHVLDLRDCLDGEKFLQVTYFILKQSNMIHVFSLINLLSFVYILFCSIYNCICRYFYHLFIHCILTILHHFYITSFRLFLVSPFPFMGLSYF